MFGDHKNWYAVYTKPRWEKKVHSLLMASGIQSYCPMTRIQKQWSDRMMMVEEPLFKSYVFVHVDDDGMNKVRMINGVVNFVYWLGKPAVVNHRDIEIIRRFLNDYSDVQALPLNFQTDSRVTILRGAFMDKRAKVVKILNNKVQVIIESLGYSLVAVIDKSNAALISKG